MTRLVWQEPEANLSFARNTALDIADKVGFVGMPPIGTSREAYVTVTLTAYNLYYFWAQTPVSTPALSIFDSEGYRLLSYDPDDIWPGSDPVTVDSVVYFAPTETGTYYLRVNYGSFPLATGFLLEGWEDVDGDYANALTQPTASVVILAWQPPFAEGTGGATRHSFVVTRFGNLSTAQSVSWFAEGNGDRPADAADFVGGVMPGGVIVFDAGQSTATITVDVQGDTLPEFAETFLVRLVDPSRGLRIERSAGVAGVTIHDDDGGATLEAASLVATEGTGTGGTFTFTVRANAPQTGQHEVRWQVDTTGLASPVTAQDFAGGILPSGVLTFGPGQTSQTVTLTFAGDTTVEAIERFRVSLQGVSAELPPRGTTSLVVELHDDDTNLVSIAAPADSAWEGNGEGATLAFVVTRSVPTAAQVVDWLAYGLEAADFADGVIPSGRLEFAAGEASRTITIRLNGDTLPERDEELTVSLGIPFGPRTT